MTGQILSFTYTTGQFFWFETITRYIYNKQNKNEFVTNFFSGGVAATLSILTSQPIDVVRTRLVSQGEPRIYKGIFDAIKKILLFEGVRGFYKGSIPAVCLTAPEGAFRFGIYKVLNKHLKFDRLKTIKKPRTNEPLTEVDVSYLQSSINGSLAGVLSKTIVYPFDLVKKRLQIQGFEEARLSFGQVVKFNGLFHCLALTIKQEGFFGIYKGIYNLFLNLVFIQLLIFIKLGYVPSMTKAAFSSGMIFFLYETISDMTRKFKTKRPIF